MTMTTTADTFIETEMAAKQLRIASENRAAAENELKDAEFKYQKLVQFRSEYVDRFDNEMKFYVAEDTHQGFRSFFSRLDVVIFEQQDIVTSLERKVKIQRQLVEECERKMQALGQEERGELIH